MFKWFTSLFRPSVSHHTTELANQVRARSKEFNRQLLEKRVQNAARQGGDAQTVVPDRWYEVTLEDLLAAILLVRDPKEADHVSDSTWGLLGEVASVFAADGKQLSEEDIAEMRKLVPEGESAGVQTLAELFVRKVERSSSRDSIAVNMLKMRGKSSE